jgi:hypothetical protein
MTADTRDEHQLAQKPAQALVKVRAGGGLLHG